MRSPTLNKLKCLDWALAALLCLGSTSLAVQTDSSQVNGVEVQIVTDRQIYSRGSTAKVKFIVTNAAETPLYLSRSLSECSNIEGSFSFQILDSDGHDVTNKGCSSDVDPTWQTHVLDQIPNPKQWIALQPGEIFGKASAFQVPKEKGTYTLKMELTSPGLTEDQRQALAQHQMRVLTGRSPAPAIKIIVK